MNNATKIRAALSLAKSYNLTALAGDQASDTAANTYLALRDIALAWYYSNLDRRCPLSWDELRSLPHVRLE